MRYTRHLRHLQLYDSCHVNHRDRTMFMQSILDVITTNATALRGIHLPVSGSWMHPLFTAVCSCTNLETFDFHHTRYVGSMVVAMTRACTRLQTIIMDIGNTVHEDIMNQTDAQSILTAGNHHHHHHHNSE